MKKNERMEKPYKSDCHNRFIGNETFYNGINQIFDYEVTILTTFFFMMRES